MASGRIHDRVILDALEQIEPEAFVGDVWRVTRSGREALRGSTAHGRWSPAGEFEVLYTSLERDGALAEIGYRLSLEPVWPSQMQHDLHRISARTERTARFPDIASLAQFGVDPGRYSSFDYATTHSLAAAVKFMGFDSLIAPSARSPALHMMLFIDDILDPDALTVTHSESVDWDAWRSRRQP